MPSGLPHEELKRIVRTIGEADLVGGWIEVVLDPRCAVGLGADYQVLVTSYDGTALLVLNRTPDSFEIHAMPGRRTRPRRVIRCAYCVLASRPATPVSARESID